MSGPTDERLRRWRLILGGDEADGTGAGLGGDDVRVDAALEALYDGDRRGGLASSAPSVARWLGDVRRYFPTPVVRVLQRDAVERLGLQRLLAEPELLEAAEPDVHLAATLLALRGAIPPETLDTARAVVRRVADDVERRLAEPLRQAVSGSLDRSVRRRRPRTAEIDWRRTVEANLRHYQPSLRTVVPERLVGYGRRRSSLADVVVCVDQSGSMAASLVYAGILASVLASVRAVQTRLVVFDTSVVDLTAALEDPVDVLFGTRLGGGTDIERALRYCETLVRRPEETVLVLVSDLFEGGDRTRLLRRAAALLAAGVRLVVLLALSDEGAPAYDHRIAAELAALGAPVFACTPGAFPELLATALRGGDVAAWAAAAGFVTARPASAG